MIKPKSIIALEGLPYIGVSALLAWITALFGFESLSVILAAVTILILYFFRDPERKTPEVPFYIGVSALLAWITALFGFESLSVILAAVTILILYFFRDPERKTPEVPFSIVSP